MIIRKIHIGQYAPFTTNVPDKDLDPHILNAETMELKPILGDALYTAIRQISDTNPNVWNVGTPYVVGNFSYSLSGGVASVYECIQANAGQALTDIAYWTPSPLGSIWYNYILPWAIFETLKKFMVWYGVHVTPSGVQVNGDTTFLPVDGQTRAGMVAEYKNNAQVYKAKFRNYMDDINWTVNTVVYEIDCDDYKPTQSTFSLRGAGKKIRK
jgi:hypothetical protein